MPFILWTELVAVVLFLSLGIFAFLQNPKSAANRNFAIFNLAVAIWTPSDLIKYIPNHANALLAYHLIYIGGSFVAFAFMMFMWSVLDKKKTRIYFVSKWLAIIFAILAQTRFLIQDIKLTVDSSNPIEEIHGFLYPVFMVFFVSSLIYSLANLVLGYRASSGIRRKQLQYILFAFFFGFVAVINFFANTVNPAIPPLFYLFMVGISAIFAVAITKHRLMDITVIIRKTLVYSTVTGTLALIYLAIIELTAHLFAGLAGYQTMFSSAIAASLAAFAFQPLRKRVQNVIDRKFFRQYVDREEKLYELSREVITHTTPEAMAHSLIRVLRDTLHPKTVSLYLKSRDSEGYVQVGQIGNDAMPQIMAENNPLTDYFLDHPLPFVQDLPSESGQPRDTRKLPAREENAA